MTTVKRWTVILDTEVPGIPDIHGNNNDILIAICLSSEAAHSLARVYRGRVTVKEVDFDLNTWLALEGTLNAAR